MQATVSANRDPGADVPVINFYDLASQRRRLGTALEQDLLKVLDHGAFLMGPEIYAAERILAERAGVRFALTCGSGTDALQLCLMAHGIGPGDAVFCPSFTFTATAEMIALLGATPVFVDVRADDFCIDPASLDAAIETARARGLKPRAIIPVDLYGQPADYAAIGAIAARDGLLILADAAQSYGASVDGRAVGSLAKATGVSFYPTKPLACYGDGGAVLTDDEEMIEILRSLRIHGQGSDRYENVRIGMNARMDTMQAVVLLHKLAIFDDEIAARNAVAQRYSDGLQDVVAVPRVTAGRRSVWAQYTICVPDRDGVATRLKAAGVPTMVYYPRPLHTQPPYRHHPCAPGGLAVTDRLAAEVLSLPMHPYLSMDAVDRVIQAVREAVRS
jgi:dTDP-4-amino-4,6-dideoxygalactose transaminase